MSARIFAEELVGEPWESLRRQRAAIFGDRGTALDAARVPEELVPLLPFASLFDTGEEGTWERFGTTMGPKVAKELWDLVVELHGDGIQAFIDTDDGTDENTAFLNLHSMCYLLASKATFEASQK